MSVYARAVQQLGLPTRVLCANCGDEMDEVDFGSDWVSFRVSVTADETVQKTERQTAYYYCSGYISGGSDGIELEDWDCQNVEYYDTVYEEVEDQDVQAIECPSCGTNVDASGVLIEWPDDDALLLSILYSGCEFTHSDDNLADDVLGIIFEDAPVTEKPGASYTLGKGGQTDTATTLDELGELRERLAKLEAS